MHMHMHTQDDTCTYIHIHMHMHTHDNTCTYIHIHMHPHTHDNTCTYCILNFIYNYAKWIILYLNNIYFIHLVNTDGMYLFIFSCNCKNLEKLYR